MNLKRRIKSFVSKIVGVNSANNILYEKIRSENRRNGLLLCAQYSKNQGISSSLCCDREVIVSLTSYGKRLRDVYLTIESIMQGTVKPNRLILWLEDGISDLPVLLQQQQQRGLEVRFCKDIRSYKKLIPCLKEFPEAIIITIDDDAFYNVDFLENLVNAHKNHPNCICANRVHRIRLDWNNLPMPYMKWDWCIQESGVSNLNFGTGVGGILYPPHCFNEEVFNEKVFMDICKTADDVWFYAMALLNHTPIFKADTNSKLGEEYVLNEDNQDMGLFNVNTNQSSKKCSNDEQLCAVLNKYDLKKHFVL
ncbi:MAG: hypothetical protein KBT32_00510 [Bacteroidales bacterium]|nr:hypothetical protein [Candidatus Physcocola equi]